MHISRRFLSLLTYTLLAFIAGANSLHAANPVGENISVEIIAGSTGAQEIRLRVTDADDPYTMGLTLELVGTNGGASHGTAVIVNLSAYLTNRKIAYTPGPSYTTGDTVTYRVKDADGNYSPNYTVTILTTPNSLPFTRNQAKIVVANTTTLIPLWGHDDEVYAGQQTLQVQLVSGPSHGTATISKSAFVPLLTYTPSNNYTGDDTITYRVGDGTAWSPDTTVKLRVRNLNGRGNATIALLVPTELYQPGQVQSEIDRLATDMTNEGFRPIIRQLDGPKSAEQMYDLISALYDEQTAAGHFLTGVTIFGDPLVYVEPPNQFFLKNLAFGTTTLDRVDLYISRIGIYGPLVDILGQDGAIRNYLDANHAYRTGQTRLPWRAMKSDWNNPYGLSTTPQNAPSDHNWRPMWDRSVWDASDTSLTDGDVLTWYSGNDGDHISKGFDLGGQYLACFSHGAANPADPTVQVMPIHVSVKFACEAGVTVRYYAYGRSGNLIAAPTAGEPSPAQMTRLLSGDYWGAIYDHLTGNVDTDDRLPLAINGDLTLPLLKTPSNALPSASFSTTYAYPDTLTSVTATAVDDTQPKSPHVPWLHSFEWYDQTTGTRNERWTFDAAHTGTNLDGGDTFSFLNEGPYNRNLVLRIQDEWGASKYVSRILPGRPHPTSLFNVNLGTTAPTTDRFDRTWWHNNTSLSGTNGNNWGSSGTTTTRSTTTAITGTQEPTLYQTQLQLSGSSTALNWRFPLANGDWTVRLHFAAIDPTVTAGQQLADIKIENATRTTAFDVRAAAGLYTAHTLDFPVTLSDGQLDLILSQSAGATIKPAIAAIQLIPAGHTEPVTGPIPAFSTLDSLDNTTAASATTVTYTLTNTGDYPLTFTAPSMVNSSNVSSTVLSAPASPIAAGASANFSLRLTPTNSGSWSTTLSLLNNSLAHNPLTTVLSGTAAANGFTSTPPLSTLVNEPFIYDVTTSAASAPITSITLPNWLTLTDHGNGTATLSGTPGNANLGSHSILLRSTSGSLTSDHAFTLIVLPATGNTPPVVATTPTTSATTGLPYASTLVATDAEGHSLTLTPLSIPAWLTFTDLGNGTATLSGTPTTDAVHPLSINVTDGLATTPWTGSLSVTTAPAFTQLPATSIKATTVTLSANLLSPGSSAATLKVYYGAEDGGTAPGSWTYQATATATDGVTYTAAITGLNPGTTYSYRFLASNDSASTWATASDTFGTASDTTASWTGASSSVWKFSANWENNFPPADDTTSHLGYFNRASYTNQPKLEAENSINGLLVGASSAYTVAITGQTSALLNLGSGGITTEAGASSFSIDDKVALTLASPQTWTHAANAPFTVSGTLDLNGHPLEINVANSSSLSSTGNRLTLGMNTLIGDGGIRKTGPGLLYLQSGNTASLAFTGGLVVEQGSISLGGNKASSLTGSTLTLKTGTTARIGQPTFIAGLASETGATFQLLKRTLTLGLPTTEDTAIFAGVINSTSNSGSVTFSGQGTHIFTGTNTYTGPTMLKSGTLQLGNSTTTGTLASPFITTATAGTLRLHRSDNLTLAQPVTGTGTLLKTGPNTLTLSAPGHSVALDLSEGTVIHNVPAPAPAVTKPASSGTGNNFWGYSTRNFTIADPSGLVIGQTATDLYGLAVSDVRILAISGTTVTLYNANSSAINVPTDTTPGLSFAATAAAPATVRDGATLAGTGTLGTVTAEANATLAPGVNGIGTLTTGDLTLANTTRLAIDLSGSTADRITVTGTLNLDGILDLTAQTTPTVGQFTLLTAGSITNNTLSLGTVPAGYSASLTVDATSVILTLSETTASPYETWHSAQSWNGKPSGPTEHADTDGMNNFLEYALGLDPLVDDPNPLSAEVTGTQFSFSYPRARADLTYTVETCTSLSPDSWTMNGVTQDTTTPVGSIATATVNIPVSTPEPQFLRLRITP